MKMECLQPSGSFKIRGIGLISQRAIQERGFKRLVASSGGNAGLAIAYAGEKLGVPVTVVVPETTPKYMRAKLADYGAEVVVHGAAWDHAHLRATELVNAYAEAGERAELIHPFDHPDLWEGHASLVHELKEQMPEEPSAIVTVVGGGGLLLGVARGMEQVGWKDVPVIACETKGADSFATAMQKREHVALEKIESVAKSLGALRVCKSLFDYCINGGPGKIAIHPVVLSDEQALRACLDFAEGERMLVEPGCGVGIAAISGNHSALDRILRKRPGPVVVIVCGGSLVNTSLLLEWRKTLNYTK